ncbi:two-component system, response regulator YesN [Paenibacillus sp. 1_12]|uniref:response regulator transcription factor n=1 Tax=Paenibacillus sp. 1_12 TaxID=1566278 RepID=UPI0008ECFE55|nr:response regulator [Paenibacillus sp. 1_12]SFK96356.1 two-component system, response regulator YesN [Paenibacillus sp. 1_12]
MFKVLLVEDEEMIRKGLRYTFDWLGSNCIVIDEAANGMDGLSKIIELQPDIVIADVNMPLMDGITMIERSVEAATCSFIIISGYDEFHLAQKAVHLGVSEYLLKPLEQHQLFEALERAKTQIELKKKYQFIKNNPNQLDEVLSAAMLNTPTKASKYVAQMITYIQENYADRISIQDLVKQLGISSTYLNQKFKSETTYTFNEFLNRYRIQKAMDQLKTGNGKVYNIASDVGFKDYKYFISIFKKYVNITPSQFQDKFKS